MNTYNKLVGRIVIYIVDIVNVMTHKSWFSTAGISGIYTL